MPRGCPSIFSDDAHRPPYDRELELWGAHGMAGTDAARPLASVDLQEGDIVIPKRRYDGFFQTNLDLTLRELGVDTLIAFGCDTNIYRRRRWPALTSAAIAASCLRMPAGPSSSARSRAASSTSADATTAGW